MAAAVLAARDLVNEIPAELTPQRLAEIAVQVAKGHGGLSCRVLDEKQMEQEKMGATLAVGRGSANPPRFIELSWEPKKPANKEDLLVLVGKGVCFDSGGLNIKPGEHMATMKMDMSGAAAVISAIGAIAELKLPVRVKAVVAAVENMPGGASYKPDDIVRALDGTTIEVGNTDAEGRLTLADALGWARKKLGATKIIDLATLTGACVVALGPIDSRAVRLRTMPGPGQCGRGRRFGREKSSAGCRWTTICGTISRARPRISRISGPPAGAGRSPRHCSCTSSPAIRRGCTWISPGPPGATAGGTT